MNIEELKAEAKRQGYKLIPVKKYEKFLPCTCGCNRREHWSGFDGATSFEILRCSKCGKEAKGHTDAEARHEWNEMIRKEQK